MVLLRLVLRQPFSKMVGKHYFTVKQMKSRKSLLSVMSVSIADENIWLV